MKDPKFDTEKKIKVAISSYTNLVAQPGWKLLEEVIDANIKALTHLIVEGLNLKGETATEKETDRLRDKLKAYKEIIGTPDNTVKRLSSPETEEINPDPYYTVEQLKEERKKASG